MQRNRILSIARSILSIPVSPFHEHGVRRYVKAFCDARPALKWSEDRFGNVLVRYRRGRVRHAFAFSAHMDHPGFEAIRSTKSGRITAQFNGGVRPELFAGAGVRFFGQRPVRGIVRSLKITRGRKTAQIDASGPVPPGTIGMWDLPVMRLRGGRLYTRSCDDSIGTVSVLCLLDALCRLRPPGDVIGVLTRAEEAGFCGALALCENRSVPKRYKFIAIETSSVLPGVEIGGGPIIRVGDRRAIFDPELTSYLEAVGRDLAGGDKSFHLQRKLMDAGTCESIVYQHYGYQSAALCIALGNYHNQGRDRIAAECVAVDDLVNLVRLHVHVVRCAARYEKLVGGLGAALKKSYSNARGKLLSTV